MASIPFHELLRLKVDMNRRVDELMHKYFTRTLALCFTDAVDSVGFGMRFGEMARGQPTRTHAGSGVGAVARTGGGIVDQAGDGVLYCFESVERAVSAMLEVQAAAPTSGVPEQEILRLHGAVHVGEMVADLPDDHEEPAVVSGNAVNFLARIMSSTGPGETRISDAVFSALDPARRLSWRPVDDVKLKGLPDLVRLWSHDPGLAAFMPNAVRVMEIDGFPPRELRFPEDNIIRVGRELENHIALSGFGDRAQYVSKHQLDIEQRGGTLVVTRRGAAAVRVDDQELPQGGSVTVTTGSRVTMGGSSGLTLELFRGGSASGDSAPSHTVFGEGIP